MFWGLIPAHAGSTTRTAILLPRIWAHPRSRGEHHTAGTLGAVGSGSSPLTRGALICWRAVSVMMGLIPAHAGSTRGGTCMFHPLWAHPRSRGEHVVDPCGDEALVGSSPLTRGAQLGDIMNGLQGGLIPAHAGSTAPFTAMTTCGPAHPRSRGEHGAANSANSMPSGSSPLTRGARSPPLVCTGPGGLIPAHAGSTTSFLNRILISGAHPRSRGEHSPSSYLRIRNSGSSPLTRGAPRSEAANAQ